jgi:stearoyl-CoA desaturase (Delta-9 desaturase)
MSSIYSQEDPVSRPESVGSKDERTGPTARRTPHTLHRGALSGFSIQQRAIGQRRLERRVAWLALLVPTIGLAAAFVTLCPALAPVSITLFASFFAISMLGVTAGYHRYFTHRAFEAVPVLQVVLAIAGSMAAQGPLVAWIAAHRRHHEHSDAASDPHSPHRGVNRWRDLAHAHVGWMLDHEPEDWKRYAPDILKNRLWLKLHFAYPWWVLLGLAAPTLAGALWTGSAAGALAGLLWGGLARIFAGHHATWSVNSLCHSFGRRPYLTFDHSTNNGLVALITFGEGWHNNHHAFPSSARHGLSWWQLDLTYVAIRALAKIGLARKVNVPKPELIARRAQLVEARLREPAGSGDTDRRATKSREGTT